MRPCYQIEITTPKKFLLRGLWFGPKQAKRVIIFIHGLTGSAFSMRDVVATLVDTKTAVVTFNNRGHGIVNKLHVGKRTVTAGSAHEVFTECVDDIRGVVNFVRKTGVKEIFLAGHSTGCQKAVYYASKMQANSRVNGLILLAPVSDYAVALRDDKKGKLKSATKYAQKLVRSGRRHELMPSSSLTQWSVDDAQRFLSLYTPNSPETIFSYEQPQKKPRTLESVGLPILVVWAEKDVYADRPARKIATWFESHLKKQDRFLIVPKVSHGFKGGERQVASAIRNWMKER